LNLVIEFSISRINFLGFAQIEKSNDSPPPKILLFTTLSMWQGGSPPTFEFFYLFYLYLFSNGRSP
jgi:hypothetical protein